MGFIIPKFQKLTKDQGAPTFEQATIVSFDPPTQSYTVTFRLVNVSGLYSLNGVAYATGAVVQVLVVNNIPQSIVP
jgi:hypothetical protein